MAVTTFDLSSRFVGFVLMVWAAINAFLALNLFLFRVGLSQKLTRTMRPPDTGRTFLDERLGTVVRRDGRRI